MEPTMTEPNDCPANLILVIYTGSPKDLAEAEYIRIREHLKVCPSCRSKVGWFMGLADD